MRAAWIAIVFLAGCPDGSSSGPDLTGMYQVTHHTSAMAQGPTLISCRAEGAAVTMPPFFQFDVDPDFGPTYHECTSSDPSSCGIGLYSFFVPNGDRWEEISSNTQMGGGTACTLYHSEHTATLESDGSVRVEIRDWDDFSPSECTLDAADALSKQEQCRAFEVVVGTKL